MTPKKRLRDLDVEAYLRDPTIKQSYVTGLFDLISKQYDRFTRVFSFGMDRRWKRELIGWLAPDVTPDAQALDLATGTGDLALAVERLVPAGSVVGIDASSAMCVLARDRSRHCNGERTTFTVGNIMSLPIRDGFADAVTIGYGLRNVPNFHAALDEIGRVLKPDGVVVNLDFYQPRSVVWRTLYLGYLRVAGAFIGWLWHREPAAYGYIASSIEHFMTAHDFTAALGQHGFVVETVRPRLWGGICLHKARKRLGT